MNLFEFFMHEAWYDQKKKDPAAEFLKSKGYDEKGRAIGSTRDSGWDAKPDPQAVALAQRPAGSDNRQFSGNTSIPAVSRVAPNPETDKVPDQLKPRYKGTIVGQQVKLNGRQVPRRVAFKDKETDKFRGGVVKTWDRDTLVWDGNDWVTPQQFDRTRKK